MPPPRRRPVPTTPTTRPRVAGLRKRPDPGTTPAAPEAAAPEAATPEVTPAEDTTNPAAEPTASARRAAAHRAADRAAAGRTERTRTEDELADEESAEADRADEVHAASTEVPGLIEPREDTAAEDGTPEPAPRPRPTGRRKRTGEAVAASVLADPQPKHAKDTPRTTAGRSGAVLPIALVVLAGLLIALGMWFERQTGRVSYNEALVDSAGTTEVAGQTREAVEKAFSYNFADVAATEKAANELLVGKAQCQYNAIFDPVRKLAPEQKLVVTVKAVSTGVTSLDGDRATVLLFLDQVTTRTTDNQTGGGIAMMRVGAQKVDGRWKVANMEMFGQTGDQAAQTAKC